MATANLSAFLGRLNAGVGSVQLQGRLSARQVDADGHTVLVAVIGPAPELERLPHFLKRLGLIPDYQADAFGRDGLDFQRETRRGKRRVKSDSLALLVNPCQFRPVFPGPGASPTASLCKNS